MENANSIDWLQWIATISSAVTAISILVIWWQVRADHERSRREKAIDVMAMWAERVAAMPPGSRNIFYLVAELDQRQCESLYLQNPFSVDEKLEYMIVGALHGNIEPLEIVKNNGRIDLNQGQVAVLRFICITYLNLLEVVFASWRHNIGDREIIKDEFAGLVTPRKDYFPIDKIRIATGKYPSIAEFTSFMKKEYSKGSGKGRIV